MKTILTLASLCLLINISAQTVQETVAVPSNVKTLKLDFEYGDVEVIGSNRSDIEITGTVSINLGAENDAFRIMTDQSGSTLKISGSVDENDLERMIIVKERDGTKKIVRKEDQRNYRMYWNRSDDDDDDDDRDEDDERDEEDKEGTEWVSYGYDIDIQLKIHVPQSMLLEAEMLYGGIEVRDMTESVDIDCTYGPASYVYLGNKIPAKINLRSTYAPVDVTIPESTKANLSMKTGYGEVYTNHTFDPKYGEDSKSTPFGEDIKAKLNGGGADVKLYSGYANIYLRKNNS